MVCSLYVHFKERFTLVAVTADLHMEIYKRLPSQYRKMEDFIKRCHAYNKFIYLSFSDDNQDAFIRQYKSMISYETAIQKKLQI